MFHTRFHITAKSIPEVAEAMKKARSVIEYFDKSTQATSKLKKNQESSTVREYREQKQPLVCLQDVITRWWSTYRALRRLRYLKKAIKALIASDEVNCPVLSDEEWWTLHQVEITLSTMAGFQRALEGEAYVTGSLSVVAVYQIRLGYETVINCEHTSDIVRELAKLLLEDWNERYHPASDGKSVKYTSKAETGKGNRYTGLHPYFFFASLLDPRTKNLIPGMMTNEDLGQLYSDVKDVMLIDLKTKRGEENAGRDEEEEEEDDNDKKMPAVEDKQNIEDGDDDNAVKEMEVDVDVPPHPPVLVGGIYSQMFAGLNTTGPAKSAETDDEGGSGEVLMAICEEEFDRYVKSKVHLSLLDKKNGKYSNPLDWWKKEQNTYPILARLAQEFLAIPATSAPSERVWSRSAQIMTLKRAKVKPELSQRMMFVRENCSLLHKYYEEIAKEWKPEEDHWLIPQEKMYLPPIYEEEETDVGQGDHLLRF